MIKDFTQLLEKFRKLQSINEIQPAVSLKNTANLLRDFEPILEIKNQETKLLTPHYNIFKILRIEFFETKVHTPFIGDLLNPDGLHSQGSLFLDSFMQHFLPKSKVGFKNYISQFLRVRIEHKTPKGIIDILITYFHPGKNKQFVIIIENKIYAGDGENQLKRYYSYAKGIKKLEDTQILLIYLTPYKYSLTSYSIDEELQDRLFKADVLKVITYNNDLIHWLNECTKQIKSEKIIQIFAQYIQTIKQFPIYEIEPTDI